MTASSQDDLVFREIPTRADAENVRRLVASTGFFHDYEIDVAVELVDERLAKGERSGYYFVFAERGGRVVGYTCYGPIACTRGSFDLFWIAVENEARGSGIGKRLMEATEPRIAAMGGKRIYIETSLKGQYAPTRAFYHRCGYAEAASLDDFYDDGDAKVIFLKRIG